MKLTPFRYFLLFVVLLSTAGCANIVPPTGGKKDVTPPKMLSVKPADSLLNTRVSRIEFRFDEFVELKNAKEVQVSPLIQFPPTLTVTGRKAVLEIPDSLLNDETTYRISLGKSIGDLHESNPIKPYTYVFSTTGYFDSLRLDGTVLDAATGRPDTGVVVLLYSASKSDSIVVKEKPLYIGRATAGKFTIAGLPDRRFRIYALKDANDNLIFDGNDEKIAFIDSIVSPSDTVTGLIELKLFKEKPLIDSAETDTASSENRFTVKKRRKGSKDVPFTYSVGVDTSNIRSRTFDITKPLVINFTEDIDSINSSKISLSYDSVVSDTVTIEIDVPYSIDTDSVRQDVIYLDANWKEGAVYTLRLLKGFAVDTAGTETMPSKYRFRAKADEDYSKLRVNLPSKYLGNKFVLLIKNDKDTVHMKPVADTVVQLVQLQPGSYQMFIIEDENENGEWDTGNLFEKRQPENVIPFSETMQLRKGWENIFDFIPEAEKTVKDKAQSPQKRESRLKN